MEEAQAPVAAGLRELYWKRTTRAGVIAGLVVGTLVTVVWELPPSLDAIAYEVISAFAASAIATILVSLATSPVA